MLCLGPFPHLSFTPNITHSFFTLTTLAARSLSLFKDESSLSVVQKGPENEK